ncbi:MAG: porin family protein [Gammaproteobacteria bacterium]|nr:porin family protein [Gammaproteobacteria bacterium]MDH5651910.1 porin family protein [Gammaproteobacteria bacterium]
MKIKSVVNALVAGALLFGTASVQAETFNTYITTSAAMSDVDNMDNGISAQITYGSRVPEIGKRFFYEAEFTTSIVDPEAPGVDLSYYTLGAYAMFAPNITDTMVLRLRAGLLYQNVEVNGKTDDDVEASFGFGVGFDLGKTTNMVVEYTRHDDDISHISVGIQFKI